MPLDYMGRTTLTGGRAATSGADGRPHVLWGVWTMAWEWSHTNEAYHFAYEQVIQKPREWLEVVFAEWQGRDGDDLDLPKYEAALAQAKELPEDTLADSIWREMEEYRTCTNGGHLAHCCPFACNSHMVPFGKGEPCN